MFIVDHHRVSQGSNVGNQLGDDLGIGQPGGALGRATITRTKLAGGQQLHITVGIKRERTGREGDLLRTWVFGGFGFHVAILGMTTCAGDTEGLRCGKESGRANRFFTVAHLREIAKQKRGAQSASRVRANHPHRGR